MVSGGFAAAYSELAPAFERRTGHHLTTIWGASMGTTPEAIPVRLERGERADVLIMVGRALERLDGQKKVTCSLRIDLAKSGIGVAVRKGAPRPDISTLDAFRKTLLAASSIAYSDSASGEYLSKVLFPRLGLAGKIEAKSRKIEGEPVGQVVARGAAELGFQQVSELLPVPGIELLGALPAEVQEWTVFSAGANAKSADPAAAQALVNFLASPEAAAAIRKSGMEPASAPQGK